MIATISHRIEVPSVQKATALRGQCEALLTEDPEVTVISSASAKETTTYIVEGVDVRQRMPFITEVEAVDEDEARDLIEAEDLVITSVSEA